jgi:hypothetical protein
MQITPARAPVGGWTPTIGPDLAVSSRSPGLVRGAFDAWRGVPETARGIALSDAMVGALTPFLAAQAGIAPSVVGDDLRSVRIVVGGPAAGAGNTATTIGHAIYVSDAARAARMLSWEGRRWLAHELVHTMQWRRSAPAAATTAARDRAFLNCYVGQFVAHEGDPRKGALLEALRTWLRERDAHASGAGASSIADAVHDAHPMEREAERIAVAFRDLTA